MRSTRMIAAIARYPVNGSAGYPSDALRRVISAQAAASGERGLPVKRERGLPVSTKSGCKALYFAHTSDRLPTSFRQAPSTSEAEKPRQERVNRPFDRPNINGLPHCAAGNYAKRLTRYAEATAVAVTPLPGAHHDTAH